MVEVTRKNPAVLARYRTLPSRAVCQTVVGELLYGASRSGRIRAEARKVRQA